MDKHMLIYIAYHVYSTIKDSMDNMEDISINSATILNINSNIWTLRSLFFTYMAQYCSPCYHKCTMGAHFYKVRYLLG